MKKNLRILIITILTAFMFCSVCFAENIENATTNNTIVENNTEKSGKNGLIEKQTEINTQIKEKNDELTEVQAEISEALQQIQELSDEISKYETEIAELNIKSDELSGSIEELEKKLIISQENYEIQKKAVEKRLVAIYEAGETRYLDVLLDSKSISDFISSYYYISEIIKYDKEILSDLENDKNRLEANKKELDRRKENIKSIRNSKERTSILLENTRILHDAYKEQLSESEKAIQEQIENYEKELRDINAQIILLSKQGFGEEYTGGIMEWPVPGHYYISSPFAMRVHPVLHVYKLHTGIDIPAPTGTNFNAAADGIVIKAEWNNAYGNMVIIDHGGGITTLYAHGSAIVATVGQEVKRGDTVLKVGSTGYSTGPHAHFEVRINGEYVQPLNYLMKSNGGSNEE